MEKFRVIKWKTKGKFACEKFKLPEQQWWFCVIVVVGYGGKSLPPREWMDSGYKGDCSWELQLLLYLTAWCLCPSKKAVSHMSLILEFCVCSLKFPARHAIQDFSDGNF